MKHIPKIERDGYMICSVQDSISEAKISSFSNRVGSGERMIAFGELQIYGTFICEGQLDIQLGTPYSYILNKNILFDTSVYGTVTVDGEVSLNGELNIL